MRISRIVSYGLVPALWAVGGATLPEDSNAAPLNIDVLSSTYKTFLHSTWRDPQTPRDTSTTRVSINPISDSVHDVVPSYGRYGIVDAAASAGMFEVMASGSTVLWSAQASAQSNMIFSPLQDASADLSIDFGRFLDYGFTGGSITLTDLTSSQELFNYKWEPLSGPGNIPWNGGPNGNTASVNLNRKFDNDHKYSLSMSVNISSNHDAELATIDISGLQVAAIQVAAVPEPSAYLLMMAALGAVGWAVRRRQGDPV